ncbi:hypothetical protein BESB_058560 [Besnoitia besnoiti]|uniref:Uncharacterized protein n=1 Tax=Besnoitia besnoiti TaxID=94643 RepID=A0A2A9MAP4_BESBE|nr:hypothetical protein BESB_058560 [Besnoitia besnoiti]PFH34969.1 hypothetical protein BESB_058560 [Besnoitia besnoiti]
MAALGRSSFRAPLRLGCFCAAAPLAAKNARVRDARSVRNNETPSRCDGRDAVGNPGVVCREARFQAFVELASIPLMSSSHLPEASDRCADRRDLGARLWLKQDAGRSLECALTAKDFRRPRANAGQDIQGRALAASAQRLERPSPLLPAVQVQLPSSVASGCPASFSSPADAPEGKSADAPACVHICRQAAGEESSCDATSGSTEGGTERAAEVADERQIGLVRLGRLRRWRVWSSQYLRGLLGELPGFLLCLPPVEACANAAAHSCGETALAAHAAQGGERTGAQRPRAEGETRARAERGSGVGDRDAHQVQGMRATGANCRPKCCCQPGHPGASEGLDAVDRRCVFTLHRTREGGSEFTGERERGAPVRLDHRTASGEESAEEEDRILRRLTQAQEGASCFALGEAGGNEADTTALLLALCLDPGLRQGFQGIAMDCVFADCKEPVCRTKLPLESGSSGLLSVGISEACLPSLRALLWKLPASLRPTLQVVRLFVDPVEREDTGSVHSPLFTAQPRQERVPPGLCGLGAPAETSGSMCGGTTRTPRCSEGSAKHGAIGGCLNAECSAGPPAMSAELDLTANSSSAGRRSGLGAVRGVPGGTAEAVREFWAHAAESAQPQRQTELLPRGIQGEATGRLARDGQADAEMGGCASAVPAPCFAVDGRGEGNLRRFLLELLAVYTSVTRVEVRILRGDPGTNFSAWNVEEASWTSEDECCSCLLSQSARLCALHAVLLSLQFELVAVRRAQYVFETFMTYETRA